MSTDDERRDGTPATVIDRLVRATNAHDLDALVGCFAAAYRNSTPAHPNRSFAGSAQVRDNWQQIFAGVPDIQVAVEAQTVDGLTVWTEWRMTGTRRDGTPHEMAGTIIFEVDGDSIASARFYVEPVERASGTVGDAVRRQVRDAPTGTPPGAVAPTAEVVSP
ncbi:nuclear transport factor 2 family protein [Leifsonia sp. NPDC056824]|uniref:nuclear transport factor 2 family protein n=1 Tax=Leifsonia sp. NPDC056824 TaxID=3345953 RepID=UPI0036AC98C4